MSGYEDRVPPGWYPDKQMAGTQRYWDGQRWTEHVQPATQAPAFEPPAPGRPATGKPPPTGKRRTVLGVVLAIGVLMAVALVVMVALGLFLATGDDSAESQSGQAGDRIDEEVTTAGVENDAETDAEIDDGSVVIGEDEPGEPGTRENPLPYDTETQLRFETFGDADGSVWLTTIGPPRDITAEVLAENQFNAPPPDGVVFVGFEASMTLFKADKEPLAPGFNFSWELLGAETAAVYQAGTIETESFGCGVIGGEFDNFSEVFVGGTVSGTVCIPFPIADLEDPDSQMAIHFVDDTRAIFGS